MFRLAFDFIITWRETRTRPNAYSEHRYLYAMSSALDFDAENFIYAVPLIPNNIKGGIGIFSIANQVKYKLKEENCQDRY